MWMILKKRKTAISAVQMIDGKTVLGVIPARGGSKRLPGKNIREFAGLPLLAWTIRAGLRSDYIDRIIVSTDNEDIKNISLKHGAEVPFLRPDNLATDQSSSYDLVAHSLKYYQSLNINYDLIVLLQPTSPLRNHGHINRAFKLLQKKRGDSIISVSKTNETNRHTVVVDENHCVKYFFDDGAYEGKVNGNMEERYSLNGAIYIIDTEKLLAQESLFLQENIYAFFMEEESSVDIDTLVDFEYAQSIINRE